MAGNRDRQEEKVTKPPDAKKGKKSPDWLIENIAEASKNARKIYFLYLGFLAYCALTVVSTSDRQIILNETVSLPILKLNVSLNGFFILAPVIAIFIFFYFQLYLNIRKKLINNLRSNHPAIGGEHLYPWMLIALDFPGQVIMGRLQSAIVKFSVWCSLPLVLVLISTWFVKKHDPVLSYVIGSAPIVGTSIVLWFWCQYEDLKFRIWQMPKIIYNNLGKSALILIVIIYEITFLLFIIPMANDGLTLSGTKGIELRLRSYLKSWFCVDLSYQKLVDEPETDYGGLYWGNLSEAHLEGANLTNTVLKRTNLEGAFLQYAVMYFAVLKEANLFRANLQKANLWRANLQKADLWRVNLRKADLREAKLQEADLREAKLQEANLGRANLQKANFGRAKLQKANLLGARLQEADLRVAELQEAMLWGANFQGADLRWANLQGAKGITIDQLSKVKTLYGSELDPELLEQIKKDYPHLLEKPKTE